MNNATHFAGDGCQPAHPPPEGRATPRPWHKHQSPNLIANEHGEQIADFDEPDDAALARATVNALHGANLTPEELPTLVEHVSHDHLCTKCQELLSVRRQSDE